MFPCLATVAAKNAPTGGPPEKREGVHEGNGEAVRPRRRRRGLYLERSDDVRLGRDADHRHCSRTEIDGSAAHRPEFRHELLSPRRSEERTAELQSLMRRSYAVCCLKKKKK